MKIDYKQLDDCLNIVKQQLLDELTPAGRWIGRLSSSALSTAVAVFSLHLADNQQHSKYINSGLNWLVDNQNSDGGWGDTPDSISNLPTTLLCVSALKSAGSASHVRAVSNAEVWTLQHTGTLQPEDIVKAVDAIYGDDKTFSVPILTMCNLAGLLGDSDKAWRYIKPLPFELAAVSPKLFKRLRLSVVSYALPALIAMGQVNYHHRKPVNPLARLLRHLTKDKTLKLLHSIQPTNGGFLEAIPLTAFVVMTLIAAGNGHTDVVKKGVRFLVDSARPGGSWPIDTDLATWLTSLSVNALDRDDLSSQQKQDIATWLLGQQYKQVHPYTNADPGGWAWTDLPGGVPDADDTPGALIALHKLASDSQQVKDAVESGIGWLMGLQNSDGGVPTFCRGWTNLDFDRSSPDLTSHTLAAMSVWRSSLEEALAEEVIASMHRMIAFLNSAQNDNGSWIPLWFGNQLAPNQHNPVYGTSRVLLGIAKLDYLFANECSAAVERAVSYLLSAQNADGGFGGDKDIPSSIEETSLALDAIAAAKSFNNVAPLKEHIESSIVRAADWLINKIQPDTPIKPAPIGLYFAKLWYSEKLYPLIFAVSALENIKKGPKR